MTIDQTTTGQAVAAAGSVKSQDPLGRDAFMSLLLTQLQHQDPTQPQADGEFLAQLAQFSTLEQLQQINQKLESMATFFTKVQSAADAAAEDA